jgi:glycosyltransferase involved in cell wall biosynthesis
MKISFIQPSRNNLKYLKWSYDAIRKNQGNHIAEICVADDFSNDGTWGWCEEMMGKDPHFKAIRNEGPTRLGHTILYDELVNKVASHEICMIYHADMYLCPGALDAIEKHMYNVIDNGDNGERVKNKKTIVSLTRIEPPLHPPGPEKVFLEWGATEPEDFKEEKFLKWFNDTLEKGEPTEGIFAPWAFWKSDFQEIGGHDPLYAPQSKEDSDIFNRFLLNGIKFIQTWEGFVYHMTCRGSRYNPTLTIPGQNSSEWEAQNVRSTRNFIRKWGHFCKHDSLMKPIIPPKYDVGFIVSNCGLPYLEILEPWCSTIYIEDDMQLIVPDYIQKEQSNTKFDLQERIKPYNNEKQNNILVSFDASKLNNQNIQILHQLSEIIKDSGEVGTFNLDIFTIDIIHMNEYQNQLIKL